MADYFTNFSLVFKLKDTKGHQYAVDLAKRVTAHRMNDEPVPDKLPKDLCDVLEDWCFETEMDKDGIWLHSQYGGIDAACAFIQHLLQKFDPKGCVTFEWSHDCNKPRVDAFGGGAAIITSTEIKTMNTGTGFVLIYPQNLDPNPVNICSVQTPTSASNVEFTLTMIWSKTNPASNLKH
jgi:hypothetical protein